MTKRTVEKNNIRNPFLYELGASLIIISCVCFVRLDKLAVFLTLSVLGIMSIVYKMLYDTNFKIRLDSCFAWLTILYTIFTVYGSLFLRFGLYNWDIMLFTYASNIALLIAFKQIMKLEKWITSINKIIFFTTIIIIGYIAITEKWDFSQVGMRLGGSLSGNVNTVGVSLGILSMFIAFLYCKEKKIWRFVIFVITVVMMFITGSRKTVVFLIADLFLFLTLADREKWVRTFLKVGIVACAFFYVLTSVNYFYNVIGYRFDDMIFSLFGIGSGKVETSSTQRIAMIWEGLRFFKNYPIFGGGEKYFASQSSLNYDYSHSNYIEMLCNFGIVGAGIFYIPLIKNMICAIKLRDCDRSSAIFCATLVGTILMLSWMMVMYSEYSIIYLPLMMSFIITSRLKAKSVKRNAKVENVSKIVEKE